MYFAAAIAGNEQTVKPVQICTGFMFCSFYET